MDLASIVGLVVCIVVVVVVMIMDGGTPAELFAHPSAIILIFGGSLAATTVTTSIGTVANLPKLIMKVFINKKVDVKESIDLLVHMAEKARRDGLLALEEGAKDVSDEFLRSGLMMVVDGVDPAQVREILETKIEQMRHRHRAGYGFFAAAGGFGPTFGIIGTVMGLISVLKQLDDPNSLARSIAGAFLATLWGLLSANLVYLPLGGKLKMRSEEEALVRYMQLEGILAIQAGENPNIVREKLNVFLPPAQLKSKKGEAVAQRAPAD